MAQKRIRQKRDTTTGLLFSNLTSLRMNELTGESAASIVLALYIYIIHMVSINWGTPIAGCFGMENHIEMDDLGVPYFKNTPHMYIYICPTIC